MKAERKGNELVITIPLLERPKPSKSGKSLLVCTSGGVRPLAIKVNGRPIQMVVNGFIYPDAPTSVTKDRNQEMPDGDEEE
jgi:hypothetical protein